LILSHPQSQILNLNGFDPVKVKHITYYFGSWWTQSQEGYLTVPSFDMIKPGADSCVKVSDTVTALVS
jgi:hypothetical protein